MFNLPFEDEHKEIINGIDYRYDFDLEKYDEMIEFDGIQHFEPVDFFGGTASYLGGVENDNIKNKWASDNKKELLRIPYWDYDNIEIILRSRGLLSPYSIAPTHSNDFIIPPYPM